MTLFAETLHRAFHELGFTTEPFRRPFTPHLTVWKASMNRVLMRKLNAAREDGSTVQDSLFQLVSGRVDTFADALDHPMSVEVLKMGERDDDGECDVEARV